MAAPLLATAFSVIVNARSPPARPRRSPAGPDQPSASTHQRGRPSIMRFRRQTDTPRVHPSVGDAWLRLLRSIVRACEPSLMESVRLLRKDRARIFGCACAAVNRWKTYIADPIMLVRCSDGVRPQRQHILSTPQLVAGPPPPSPPDIRTHARTHACTHMHTRTLLLIFFGPKPRQRNAHDTRGVYEIVWHVWCGGLADRARSEVVRNCSVLMLMLLMLLLFHALDNGMRAACVFVRTFINRFRACASARTGWARIGTANVPAIPSRSLRLVIKTDYRH